MHPSVPEERRSKSAPRDTNTGLFTFLLTLLLFLRRSSQSSSGKWLKRKEPRNNKQQHINNRDRKVVLIVPFPPPVTHYQVVYLDVCIIAVTKLEIWTVCHPANVFTAPFIELLLFSLLLSHTSSQERVLPRLWDGDIKEIHKYISSV